MSDVINMPVRHVATDLDPIMQPHPLGAWVHMEDYYAQSARIEELEAELEGHKKLMLTLAGDKIDLVSELAGVKFKLAKAMGFIQNSALRAMIEEHDEDERDMIDFDSLRFERDCDIVQARTIIAELSKERSDEKGETDE